MLVEYAASASATNDSYDYRITTTHDHGTRFVFDWEPMIQGLLRDREAGVGINEIAAKFHNALVAGLAAIALQDAKETGQDRVVLSGGCFQNRLLLEKCIAALRAAGLSPFWHRNIPPNDGGICVGQAAIALARWQRDAEADHVSGDSR